MIGTNIGRNWQRKGPGQMINEFIPPATVMNQLHGQAQSSLRRQIGRLFLMILSLPLTSLSLATGSSPNTGIGSEGYIAIKMGRRFIGSELKKSYYELAIRNLDQASKTNIDLFSDLDIAI